MYATFLEVPLDLEFMTLISDTLVLIFFLGDNSVKCKQFLAINMEKQQKKHLVFTNFMKILHLNF